MKRLNIYLTPDFEKDLLKFMRLRRLPTKAAAIRIAIKESLLQLQKNKTDFTRWLGLAIQVPVNKNMKFKNNELW